MTSFITEVDSTSRTNPTPKPHPPIRIDENILELEKDEELATFGDEFRSTFAKFYENLKESKNSYQDLESRLSFTPGQAKQTTEDETKELFGEKVEKIPSREILRKSILFKTEDTFLNSFPVIQDYRRSYLLSEMREKLSFSYLKKKSFQEEILEQLEYKSNLRLKMKEISDKLQSDTEKRLEKLLFLKQDIESKIFKLKLVHFSIHENEDEKIVFCLNKIENEMRKEKELLNALKSNRTFENRSEQMKNSVRVSVGMSKELIYDTPKPAEHENFAYLSQGFIRRITNYNINYIYSNKKLNKLKQITSNLPEVVQFKLCIFGDELLLPEIDTLKKHGPFMLPETMDEICRFIQKDNSLFGFESDVNMNSSAIVLYKAEEYFRAQFQEQTEKLTISEYTLKTDFTRRQAELSKLENLNKKSRIEERNNPELALREDETLRKRLKTMGTGWLGSLQDLPMGSNDTKKQNIILLPFFDSQLVVWRKLLLTGPLSEFEIKLSRKMKDFALHHPKKAKLQDTFFDFYQSYLKILAIKSRKSMIKLLSYCNFFRSLQKSLTLLAHVDLDTLGDVEHPPLTEWIKRDNDMISPDGDIFSLFESGKVHESYRLTNPCLPQYGKLNEYQSKVGKPKDERSGLHKSLNESQEEIIKVNLNMEDTIFFEEEIIKIKDFNRESVVYDSAIHDFYFLTEEVIRICGFYFHFIRQKDKKSLSLVSKGDQAFQENFDRENLFYEILEYERQYQFSKAKLLMIYYRLLKNCLLNKKRRRLVRLIMELKAKRPNFDGNNQTVFEVYQLEIRTLEAKLELVSELYHTKKEQEEAIFRAITSFKKNAPDSVVEKPKVLARSLSRSMTKEEMTSTNKEENDWLEDGIEGLPPLFKGLKLEPRYIMMEKMVGFLELMERTLERSSRQRLVERDTLKISVIEQLVLQQILNFWRKIESNINMFEDIVDFLFLDYDPILDKPHTFDLYRKDAFKLLFEKKEASSQEKSTNKIQGGNSVKNTRASGGAGLMLRTLKTMNLNKILKIDRPGFLKTIFHFNSFLKLRSRIKNFLFVSAFLMEVYKEQLTLFHPNEETWSTVLNYSDHDVENINHLKYFLNMEPIQFDFELLDLEGWMNLHNQEGELKKIQALFKVLFATKHSLLTAICTNNIYLLEIRKQFPNYDDFLNKVQNSGAHHFYNIYDVRSRSIDLVNNIKKLQIVKHTMNIVRSLTKGKSIVASLAGSKNKEAFKSNISSQTNSMEEIGIITEKDTNHGLESGGNSYRITSRVELFCRLILKQVFFDLLKLETINMIIELKNMDEKFPFDTKIFKQNPLSDPMAQKVPLQYDGANLNIFSDNMMPFYDNFGYAVNLFFLPNTEELIRMTIKDLNEEELLNTNMVINTDEGENQKESIKIDPKEVERQLYENGTEIRSTYKTKHRRPRNIFFRARTLYKKKKHYKVPILEFLEKTEVFLMMKVYTNLYLIFTMEIFLGNLESHSEDILLFLEGEYRNGKMKVNYNEEIPLHKKNELRLRQDLDSVKALVKKLLENLQKVKHNDRIINVNEGVIYYLRGLYKRKFSAILLLMLKIMPELRSNGDLDFLRKIKNFLAKILFPKLIDVSVVADQSGLRELFLPFVDRKTFGFNVHLHNKNPRVLEMIETVFMESEPEKPSSSFSDFINRSLLDRCDNLLVGLLDLNKSKKIKLSTKLIEMNVAANEFVNKKGIYETQDMYFYEQAVRGIFKLNMRISFLKEISYFISKKSIPFDGFASEIENAYQNSKVEERIKQFQKGKKFEDDEQFEANKNFGDILVLDVNRINYWIIAYSEAIEKLLIKNTIRKYQAWIENFKVTRYQSGDAGLRFQHYNVLDKTLGPLTKFFFKILLGSYELETNNRGAGLVLPLTMILEHLDELSDDIRGLQKRELQKIYRRLMGNYMPAIQELIDYKKENKNQCAALNCAEENIYKLVDVRVAQKSAQNLYDLDFLEVNMKMLQDQYALKEQEIREATRRNFVEKLRDQKMDLQVVTSRFHDFKMGMNLEVKKQLNESKGDALKSLKKKVLAVRGENTNFAFSTSSMIEFEEERVSVRKDDDNNRLLDLYSKVKMMRSIAQLKEICIREKFEKQIENMNDNSIKSETLWKKMSDLRTKHEALNLEIENSKKKLAYLQVQHGVLSKDWKKSKLDYEILNQKNNEKGKRIETLEDRFSKLKKRKTIDKNKNRLKETINDQGTSSKKELIPPMKSTEIKQISQLGSDIKPSIHRPEERELNKFEVDDEEEYVSEDAEGNEEDAEGNGEDAEGNGDDSEGNEEAADFERVSMDQFNAHGELQKSTSRTNFRPQSASLNLEKRNLRVGFSKEDLD